MKNSLLEKYQIVFKALTKIASIRATGDFVRPMLEEATRIAQEALQDAIDIEDSNENQSSERLETLLLQFESCKWSDAGPLAWWKPEDEKYISRESLLKRIDEEIV